MSLAQIPEMLARFAEQGMVEAEISFWLDRRSDLVIRVRGDVGAMRVGGQTVIPGRNLKAYRFEIISFELSALEKKVAVEIERLRG